MIDVKISSSRFLSNMKNERPEVKAAKNERFSFKGSFLICWKWGKWIFLLYWCSFLFQIKSVHSLDCDQESVWHVYHVCDCPQFHCSGFWRSCLREIWKEQIFGICRLWFHCHLYIGMLFKGQFSYPFIQSQVPTFQIFVLLDGGSGICASSWSFHEGLLELHGYHCGHIAQKGSNGLEVNNQHVVA